MRWEMITGLGIVVVTTAAFWSLNNCEFITFDDHEYVVENTMVNRGLRLQTIGWAFTGVVSANWHPLTLLSHALDCQFFGLNPRAHHLMNLCLHIVNALLLFTLLLRITGHLRPSALTAAFFAVHPLHVESVAWISERKDVLSTMFWLLTTLAYVRYANESRNQLRKKGLSYWLALGFFALGLMSKPMLVTLPLVLLLLDYWPLQRLELKAGGLSSPQLRACLREKIPFFVLTIVSSAVTFIVQARSGAVVPTSHLGLVDRVGNAVISYIRYLCKTVWPTDLAFFYPHPGAWPLWQVIGAGLALAFFTTGVVLMARRFPYLPVGWFWYLCTLVPVIGIVQVGSQAIADRYTYVPLIGLFIMVAWGLQNAEKLGRLCNVALSLVELAGVVVIAGLTAKQVCYWKDSVTLFQHAVAVTTNNPVAHKELGNALIIQGRTTEGMHHLLEAIRLQPNYAEAHAKIALALANQGNAAEAAQYYRQALQVAPDLVEVLNNFAWLLATCPNASLRDGEAAVRYAERACELTHYNKPIMIGTLAAAYAEAGRFQQAVAMAEKAQSLATKFGLVNLAQKNQQLLKLYRSGQPYHEPAEPNSQSTKVVP